MNNELIVQIGTIVIALLGALVTYIVIPFIRSKTTKEQRDNVHFWVWIAVNAAEMIYKEKGQGVLKKEYVLNFLRENGVDILEEQLDALIEASVYELNKIKAELAEEKPPA